jgi:ELWxxDGT repeat protein
MTLLGSTSLFTAFGPTGTELWVTNGTPAGTLLLVDIDGGNGSGVRSSLTLWQDRVYFAGRTSATGVEPWVSDGTPEGTEMLENIGPGSASSDPTQFVPLADGYLYFLTTNDEGFELWRTDGTPSGTNRRAYRDDGTTLGSSPMMVGLAGTQLLLRAKDGFAGEELWRTTGGGGLSRLANIAPDLGDGYPIYYVEASGRLYFSAEDAAGRELWTSDLTGTGTYRVEDLYPGPLGLTVPVLAWNGALYSIGFSLDEGQELRRVVDPTLGSTVVRDIVPGPGSSSPSIPVPIRERFVFEAYHPDSGRELWTSDGTELGTTLLEDIAPGSEGGLSYVFTVAELDGYLYFPASDGVHGLEVWRTDGTSAEMVRDLYLGPSDSFPGGFVTFQDEVFFAAWTESGSELWKSDGTVQGTNLVRDVHPSGNGSPWILGVAGSHLLFRVSHPDLGEELWRTDGTEAGTELLVDIWPGSSSSSIGEALAIGGLLYFVATDPVYGREIWRSDGTSSGTYRVADLRPGVLSALPKGLVGLPDGTFVFSAYSEEHGFELWRSDGTAPGTQRVTDIAPGPAHSVELSSTSVVVGDWLVFTATDGVTGREPWAYRFRPEAPFFADGFETGDPSLWSSSVP